jgi:hypothetical protein
MSPDPGRKAIRVAIELQPCHLDGAAPMARWGAAWKWGAGPHSMKKGREGSAAACSMPAIRHRMSLPARPARVPAPTDNPSRWATSSSLCVRTAQPSGWASSACTRATQRPNGLCGLGLIDDRDQLEVGLAERHEPVGRAPAGVTAALD